jgi:hypothetical protein
VTSFRLGTAQAGYTTHFARIGNVARWIAAPHNNSAPFNGIGFIQARNARQCVGAPNRNVGTAALLYECEGYDPNIHHQLWELVPVTGTSFFKIRMARSGANRCLSVRAVRTWSICTSGGQEQEWSRVTVSSTDALHYKIRSRSTNLFLTPASGSGVFVTTASASNNDHWLFYR